jgi:hypothetical protein
MKGSYGEDLARHSGFEPYADDGNVVSVASARGTGEQHQGIHFGIRAERVTSARGVVTVCRTHECFRCGRMRILWHACSLKDYTQQGSWGSAPNRRQFQ